MSKILVKSSSGIMGGSDTRIYNPRSESSHMYRNNHEEEDKYGRESSEARDERYDRKLRIKEKKDKEKNKIKHIKMSAQDLVGVENEKEEAEEGDKFDTDRELSAQTGPAGNMGFLTSLAAQAKGPGAAGGSAFAMGEPMEIAYQLLKSKQVSEKTKKKKRERRRTKEKRQQWRPSTGQFKTPPGGSLGPEDATNKRFKNQMRSVKRGKKTGLMRSDLAVEMEHRGVATKQPKSKDVAAYKEFMGQQESHKRIGRVRSPTSLQSRSGARSYFAGKTGGGRLQGMAGFPKPRLKPHRLPPITPPRTLAVPHLNQPQMSGPGATGYMPMQTPLPSSMPIDATSQPSMVVAKGAFGLTTIELGKILRIAERTLRAKEKKKKSTGNRETVDADQTPTGQTTKPQGGTEDHRMENIGGVKGLRGNTQ